MFYVRLCDVGLLFAMGNSIFAHAFVGGPPFRLAYEHIGTAQRLHSDCLFLRDLLVVVVVGGGNACGVLFMFKVRQGFWGMPRGSVPMKDVPSGDTR